MFSFCLLYLLLTFKLVKTRIKGSEKKVENPFSLSRFLNAKIQQELLPTKNEMLKYLNSMDYEKQQNVII